MKSKLTYLLALVGLFVAGCAEPELPPREAPATGDGALCLSFMTAEPDTETDYNPFDYCTIRLFNEEGLVRKYYSQEELPEQLWLAADSYRVEVEAGDRAAATFVGKSYFGAADFTIVAGEEQRVEVACQSVDATVEVDFDTTLAEKLTEGYTVMVMADEERMLTYTSSGEGYFLVEQETLPLYWCFMGHHPEDGDLYHEGLIEAKAGAHYTLRFAYSPDAAGKIDFTLVTEEPEVENDEVVFYPQPQIEALDFDTTELQRVENLACTLSVRSFYPLAGVALTLNGGESVLLTESGVAGAALTVVSEKEWQIRLSDELFAACGGGRQLLTITAADSYGTTAECEAAFLTEGVATVTAADYDLWLNTARLKVVSFDSSASNVEIQLRKGEGEWTTYAAAREDDYTFVAEVTPQWRESTNLSGEAAWLPDASTGIFANASYEVKAMVDGVELPTTVKFNTTVDQPIPGGDMEDATLPCFTVSGSSSTSFWGSGNNSYVKTLCTQKSKTGQGGEYCALLKSGLYMVLATGNLFTGTFVKPAMIGTVGFGQDYDWKARPTALRLKYHAKIGKVNKVKYKDESGSYPIAMNKQDKGRIYVAIVDWSARHEVASGIAASGLPSGMFDPEAQSSVDEGAIIGYGSYYIEASTSGTELVELEIPIAYYDKIAKPESTYKIVISCAASAFGDYMCGCSTNEIYVDDFEWVY